MLIVKVFVNLKQIDEIQIHNTGYLTAKGPRGKTVYEIVKPEGFGAIKIAHKRSERYYRLLRDALNLILGE